MELPQVTNIRQLTVQDALAIWAIIEVSDNSDYKFNAFDMLSIDEYSERSFVDQDFVIGDVVIEEKPYRFIHGYPGDEPCGVLFTPDLSVVESLHWSADMGHGALNDWYLKSVNVYDDEEDDFETIIPKSWFAPD